MATNTAHPTARPDISLRVPNLEQLRDLAAEVPDIIGRLDSGVAAVTDALDRHTDRAAATSATAAVRELRDLAAGALLTADQVVDELEPIITKIRSYPDHFTQTLVDVEIGNATAPLSGLGFDLRRLRPLLDQVDAAIARLATPAQHDPATEALVRQELEMMIEAPATSASDFTRSDLMEIANEDRYARTLAGPFGRALEARYGIGVHQAIDNARTALAGTDPAMSSAATSVAAFAPLAESLRVASWVTTKIAAAADITLDSSL